MPKKKRIGSGVVTVVLKGEDGRGTVAVGVTDDLTAKYSAGDLIKLATVALGGQGGGGRPDMAQGGGPDGAQGRRGDRSRSRRALAQTQTERLRWNRSALQTLRRLSAGACAPACARAGPWSSSSPRGPGRSRRA